MRSLLAHRNSDVAFHTAATEVCQKAGLTDIALRLCIHDYVATEDVAMVRNMAAAFTKPARI